MTYDVMTVITTVILPILCAFIGGIITWLWKLDDRSYQLRGEVLTKQEFYDTIKNMESKIDKLSDKVSKNV